MVAEALRRILTRLKEEAKIKGVHVSKNLHIFYLLFLDDVLFFGVTTRKHHIVDVLTKVFSVTRLEKLFKKP
jgi:hypothetical protein